MGRVALPELKEESGYDDKVSNGCVAAGGTMAIMIPPSVLFVIYGDIAGESYPPLLLAGILPGLLRAITYVVMLLIRFKLNPALGPPDPRHHLVRPFQLTQGHLGHDRVIMLVMGSMYTGLATPTEAAGIGAIGALIMALPGGLAFGNSPLPWSRQCGPPR